MASTLRSGTPTSRPRTARFTPTSANSEQNHEIIKSLQLKNDERYERMDYYRAHGGTSSTSGHFVELKKTGRRMVGRVEELPDVKPDSTANDIAIRALEDEQDGVGELFQIPRQRTVDIESRMQWQASFDRHVKRLFVDFNLSDVPSCRLNHLERMNNWFQEQGGKQERKSAQGPCFLVADRGSVMPPGSTKNIPDRQNQQGMDGVMCSNGNSQRRQRNTRP